jgi:transcriptional regulator of acetoin/glycerol metabolism
LKLHVKEGVAFGRTRKEIDDRFLRVYQEWKDGLISATEAMRKIDMKRTTFYRRVKEIDEQGSQEVHILS